MHIHYLKNDGAYSGVRIHSCKAQAMTFFQNRRLPSDEGDITSPFHPASLPKIASSLCEYQDMQRGYTLSVYRRLRAPVASLWHPCSSASR
jgi:hypothetical protein